MKAYLYLLAVVISTLGLEANATCSFVTVTKDKQDNGSLEDIKRSNKLTSILIKKNGKTLGSYPSLNKAMKSFANKHRNQCPDKEQTTCEITKVRIAGELNQELLEKHTSRLHVCSIGPDKSGPCETLLTIRPRDLKPFRKFQEGYAITQNGKRLAAYSEMLSADEGLNKFVEAGVCHSGLDSFLDEMANAPETVLEEPVLEEKSPEMAPEEIIDVQAEMDRIVAESRAFLQENLKVEIVLPEFPTAESVLQK